MPPTRHKTHRTLSLSGVCLPPLFCRNSFWRSFLDFVLSRCTGEPTTSTMTSSGCVITKTQERARAASSVLPCTIRPAAARIPGTKMAIEVTARLVRSRTSRAGEACARRSKFSWKSELTWTVVLFRYTHVPHKTDFPALMATRRYSLLRYRTRLHHPTTSSTCPDSRD